LGLSEGIFKIMTTDKMHGKAAGGDPRIEILLVGMNGDLRGKQIPLEAEKKVWAGEVRLPSSTQSLDIWGDDNDDITGLSLSVGDPDGQCIPDKRSLTPMPWAPEGSVQVLATMHEFDGTPSFMDPRAILASVLKRYADRGLTPVVATELEFYVVAPDWRETGRPTPPESLTYQGEPNGFQLYDMGAVDALDDYLQTVRAYARRRDCPLMRRRRNSAPASSRSTCCTGRMRWLRPTTAST
jgi:glutamine synthetase